MKNNIIPIKNMSHFEAGKNLPLMVKAIQFWFAFPFSSLTISHDNTTGLE